MSTTIRAKLRGIARHKECARELERELHREVFSDFCNFGIGEVLHNCTVDGDTLKTHQGTILSTGRAHDLHGLTVFYNSRTNDHAHAYCGEMYIALDEAGTFAVVYYEC